MSNKEGRSITKNLVHHTEKRRPDPDCKRDIKKMKPRISIPRKAKKRTNYTG